MNRFCSIFSQLLQLFSRIEFQQAVVETKAECHARGFTCWGQFVAMLFCQLGRAHSLREITGGLRSCEDKLKHLGITALSRSTLAYANEHRPWQLYQRIFMQLFERCQSQVKVKKKFRFKNKLVGLDSTIIDLCISLFDWAKFRRTKGAIKLHMLLDHDGYLPCFAVITEGKVADVKVVSEFHWTLKRIAQTIHKYFRIRYHANHVWWLLRGDGMELSETRASGVTQDDKEIAHWKVHRGRI
jgi:transposase